jgi:hypothetical protein
VRTVPANSRQFVPANSGLSPPIQAMKCAAKRVSPPAGAVPRIWTQDVPPRLVGNAESAKVHASEVCLSESEIDAGQ